MRYPLIGRGAAGRFVLWLALLAVAGRGVATANVDVQVLVLSSGKGSDRLSVTYAGSVPHEQAKADLQALSAALNRQPSDIRVTTRSIAARAPEMTSVEVSFPELVNRAAGELPVQPFVETYRRYSHLHLTYFIDGAFKLVSPAKSFQRGDVRMVVDNRGGLVDYDVWIRHADGASPRIPSLANPDPWARLLGPGLFLVLLLAAAVGVAVFVLLRRSGAERASTG